MLLHAKEAIAVKAGPMALYYPKWIPGEHGPDGPIANLTGLRFEAGGKAIPWRRDQVDVFKFHVEVPTGITELQVSYDYLEPQGMSATDKLLVLEWNEVVLYPADVPAAQLVYESSAENVARGMALSWDGSGIGLAIGESNRVQADVARDAGGFAGDRG